MILILFNILNAFFDASRIKKNKRIYHGLNLLAYCVVMGFEVWLFEIRGWWIVLYCLSAFFNRQLFFDIPLNLARGLTWDYVSKEKLPKAKMDRIEIWMFGLNGKPPVLVYSIGWIITTGILLIFKA